MNENQLAKIVLDHSFNIHKNLGPGLLESAYESCLYYELSNSGIQIERQKGLPLKYKEVKMDVGYRIDLILENKLIVEIKSVEALADIHLAQTLTYLRLADCKLGLLLNFNVVLLKSGIRRVVNGL